LIVRDLASARSIAVHAPGFRLITLQGDLLEPDGTLTVGTHHAEAGILSRKSEWRELNDQLGALDANITQTETMLQELRDQLHVAEIAVQERQEEIVVLAEQDA